MIYAQRPNATACASYDLWNKRMGRFVHRHSQGIALIDATGDQPRLKYVFDISDTGGREQSRRPLLWEMRSEHESVVSDALEREYGVTGKDGLADQIHAVAMQLADLYWQDNRRDILYNIDGCYAAEYDEFNQEAAFVQATAISITYTKAFLAEHESDILLHKAAKKAFDELGVKKLPTVKALQTEYAALLQTKKAAYAEWRVEHPRHGDEAVRTYSR